MALRSVYYLTGSLDDPVDWVYQILIRRTHRDRRGGPRIRTRRVRGDSRRGALLSGSRTGGDPRHGGDSRHTSCGAPRCGAGSGSRGGGCAPNKAVNEGPRMFLSARRRPLAY